MRLCPPLLFSCFRLLRRGGYRGNIGLLYCGVERGEILGLDFMPGSQLRFETRIEFVEHGVGCGGRRAVRAFYGFLQICELVGYLNRKIQRVLSALGFRLNDFFFDGVHFFVEGIDGFEDWFRARVRRQTLFQSVKLASYAANLIHRFVPCAHATAYAQRELLLFLKIGLRCGDARVFGEFDAGGGSSCPGLLTPNSSSSGEAPAADFLLEYLRTSLPLASKISSVIWSLGAVFSQ